MSCQNSKLTVSLKENNTTTIDREGKYVKTSERNVHVCRPSSVH